MGQRPTITPAREVEVLQAVEDLAAVFERRGLFVDRQQIIRQFYPEGYEVSQGPAEPPRSPA